MTSPAAELLVSLRQQGLSLRQDGKQLIAWPADLVTPPIRQAIAANKPALLAELERERLRRDLDRLANEIHDRWGHVDIRHRDPAAREALRAWLRLNDHYLALCEGCE